MWPFAESASVEQEAPPLTPAQQLAECEEQYRAAEREFNTAHRELFDYAKTHPDSRSLLLNGDLFCRINAMTADPVRTKMEAARAKALARRNELLAQRAQLLKDSRTNPLRRHHG